jgi:glycosyltransferase involved in cell wall biosynthesis
MAMSSMSSVILSIIDLRVPEMNQLSQQPLVSVIVPLYNGEAHIVDALHSIACQTYSNLEIIVVDDGSQDRGAAAVRGVRDQRLRYLHQPNAGTASARNAGVRASSGRYLAFLDQDDLWLPDKLATQMAALLSDDAPDLLLGHVWQGAVAAGSSAAEALQKDGRRLAGYLPSTLVTTRETFLQVGQFAEARTLTESFDWFVRAREKRLKHLMLDEIVAIRRVHHANKGIKQRHARAEYAQVLKAALDRRRGGTVPLSPGGAG